MSGKWFSTVSDQRLASRSSRSGSPRSQARFASLRRTNSGGRSGVRGPVSAIGPGLQYNRAVAVERKLMTAEELLRLSDDGMRHELLDGELRTMAPAGGPHGRSGGWAA